MPFSLLFTPQECRFLGKVGMGRLLGSSYDPCGSYGPPWSVWTLVFTRLFDLILLSWPILLCFVFSSQFSNLFSLILCYPFALTYLLSTNLFCLLNIQKIAKKRKFATSPIRCLISYFGMNYFDILFLTFSFLCILPCHVILVLSFISFTNTYKKK